MTFVNNKMKHIKEGQKYSFIGIVLGIPIIVLLCMFVIELNSQIKLQEEKMNGAYYNRNLKKVLQNVLEYRGLHIYSFIDDDFSNGNLDNKRNEITKQLKSIVEYDKDFGQSRLVSESLVELVKDWDDMQFHLYFTPHQALITFNEYIDSFMNLIELVANDYKLILTIDESFYYVSKDVTQTFPLLIEQLGQINSLAIISKNNLNISDLRQINSLISTSKQLLSDLETSGLLKGRANNNEDVYLLKDTYLLLKNIETYYEDDRNNNEVSFNKLINHSEATINNLFNMYDNKLTIVEGKLEKQIQHLMKIRLNVSIFLSFATVLTAYCFVGFYIFLRNMIRKVRKEGFIQGYRTLFSQLKRVEDKYEEAQKRLNEVERTMSQKVMQAYENERKRVSRELHDGLGQYLYSILVKLTVIKKDFQNEKVNQSLDTIKDITEQAIKETKNIAQSLRPGLLDDFGLIPAVKSYINNYMKIYEIKVHFKYKDFKERLNSEIETNLYRIIQEALTNIAKHSKAKLIILMINIKETEIELYIKDDGIGFNVEQYLFRDDCEGIGLFSMKERAELLGGKIEVLSSEGEGTTINVTIPNNLS